MVAGISLYPGLVRTEADRYMRFDPRNMDGYLAEHWPFWAGMTGVGVLLLLVGLVGRRRSP